MTTNTTIAWTLPPWPPGLELSIILGTYNRKGPLQTTLRAVAQAARTTPHEIIVCDGGSTDGSREWLAAQPNVVFIGDRHLDGAVAAFNLCFALARGRYVATLNDDCLPEPGVLDYGVSVLKEKPTVGQVAFELQVQGRWQVNTFRELPWANYGIIRTDLARRIAGICGGLWAPAYRTYGADVELSFWVHRLGFQVEPLPGQRVADLPAQDELRKRNAQDGARDAARLYARWPSNAHVIGTEDPLVEETTLKIWKALQ